MSFLFFQPSMIVPILLFILILLVLIGIIAISINERRRIKKMENQVKRMRKMAAAISRVNLVGEEMEAKEAKIQETRFTPIQITPKQETPSGDRTIYDDRKKLTTWQVHLSDTYRAMKEKDPDATFQDAMKAAKKTYKKPGTPKTTKKKTPTKKKTTTSKKPAKKKTPAKKKK